MTENTYIITNKIYKIIKVGSSKNPYKRLKAIQVSNSIELESDFLKLFNRNH